MTDNELRDAAVAALKETKVSYPAWVKMRDRGDYADITKTKWWQAFNYLGQIGLNPPTVIRDAPGLGLNVTTRQDISDVLIDGTGDSGVLFQKDAGGSTLRRCTMRRVAAGNAVAYGKHGVYGKAPNLTLADIDIECSPYCASGLSMRYHGAVVDGFRVAGAPHAITYYETSTTPGSVEFVNGCGSFTADTGVWIDIESDYTQRVVQAFTFRNVSLHGDGAFLKASTGFFGPILLDGCTLNFKPVTAADCPGVPNLTIR